MGLMMKVRAVYFLVIFVPLMLVNNPVFADPFDDFFCEIDPIFCESEITYY